MLYSILCYDRENEVFAMTEEEDSELMAKLSAVTEKQEAAGRLGPTTSPIGSGSA